MAHYYDEQPDAVSKERELTFSYGGITLHFLADTGVFSKDHVDDGSALLLEGLKLIMEALASENKSLYTQLANGKCLDLGSGYGVLGISAKRRFPGQTWTFSDVNERALDLTARNAEANGIYRPKTIKSHGFENLPDHYDLIISNPPIRIGKEQVYDLFRGSATHLNSGGLCLFVIGKKQGAESAGRFLKTLFTDVNVVLKKKGFFVYVCAHPSEQTTSNEQSTSGEQPTTVEQVATVEQAATGEQAVTGQSRPQQPQQPATSKGGDQ